MCQDNMPILAICNAYDINLLEAFKIVENRT